jgi:Nucleotidyl transferase AbiEii toxin, Type IV TA system
VKYKTAAAFRRALDDRLRESVQPGEDLARLQRRAAYERVLARMFKPTHSPWVLKGGYALELRLGSRARATKDLDFNAPPGSPQLWLEERRDAADLNLGDFFTFTAEDVRQGDLRGPPGGSQLTRLPVYQGRPAPESITAGGRRDGGCGDVPRQTNKGHGGPSCSGDKS